jgi:hypothetical protein
VVTAVAFTGQVRDQSLFVETLRVVRRLFTDGLCDRVVYSDWAGALDHYPDVRRALRAVDAHVVELPAMTVKGPGNVLTQTRSLSAALVGLDGADHVLKSRPDCHLSEPLLRRVLDPASTDRRISAPDGEAVFAERLWVPWFHTSRIMHLSDEAFFGLVDDVRKLQRCDPGFDREFGPPLSHVHTRRFASPLLQRHPELRTYFRVWTQVVPERRGRGDLARQLTTLACEIPNYRYLLHGAVVAAGLSSRSFVRLLALYYVLLTRYFVVDGGRPGVDFYVRRGPTSRERTHGHALRDDLLRSGDPCVRCYDADWLALNFGPRDELAASLREAVSEVEATGCADVDDGDAARDRAVVDAVLRTWAVRRAPSILGRRLALVARTRSRQGTRR